MKKVRMGVIAVLVFASVGLASSASACEKCVDAGYNNWVKCSSGASSGHQSCSGGFGVSCTLTGSCGSGGGGPAEVENPTPLLDEPCLTCSEEAPSQGFVLRSDHTPLDVTAEP